MKIFLFLVCVAFVLVKAESKDEKRRELRLKKVGYHKSDVLTVYFSEEAASNYECRQLDCKDTEVCILFKNGNATCMKEKHWRKLTDTNRFHKGVKPEKLANYRADCPACPVVRPVFVCGTDNVTYSSDCRLAYKNCEANTNVKVACQGRCPCKSQTVLSTASEISKMSSRNRMPDVPAEQAFVADRENHITIHRIGKIKSDRCSKKQMRELRGRLVNWFHIIVRQNVPGNLTEILKSPVCIRGHAHEVISWMFNNFDDNKDRKLSLAELFELEADKFEHCINPLLESCDRNLDLDISGPEWCQCFQEKPRNESKKPSRSRRI